ncbi:MAG: hypothetical protein HY909_20885 [Deltaproteobacteria bacterium]|nr:hypothetical protein [Deltaproteobacteria bacterium]
MRVRGSLTLAGVLSPALALGDPPEPQLPTPPPEPEARPGFFEPVGPARWRLRALAGLSLDVLPRRLVASELRQVPMVLAGLRVGLPAGFFGDVRLRAVVLNNELQLGAGWGRRFGRWLLGAHYRAAFWFGFMGVTGFDVSSFGLMSQPGLSLGVEHNGTRATLTAELIVVHTQRVNLGGSVLSRDPQNLGGFSFTLVAETPVNRRGGMIFYGVTLLAAVPDYQLWVAFAPTTNLLPYPRFMVGYEF